MFGEVPDPFSTVEGLWGEPGAVIITANTGLKAPDCVQIADRHNGVVISGSWVDSKGNHEVPCVLVSDFIHITDLGNKLLVGAVLKTKYGDTVRPAPLDTVRKGVNWPLLLDAVINHHTHAIKAAEGRIYPPSKDQVRQHISSKQAENEFELFLRGHQN